ncbi:MAG: Spx/MgsR family RNA polymerase-binding regulatory protein [Bdellovibrionaceae bacterium]|nr:Spx/MgsR family RNA polymerase-binding regulatory protein [Pseudobdellovibrionaceae bacterium]
MPIKIYEYSNCSTCKNALKFAEARGVKYEKLPIVDQPPTVAELKTMLGHLREQGFDFKKLFNTSGVQYRELGISEKIKAGMTEAEALKLLSTNGKLIKRPFLLTAKGGTVGFDAKTWGALL